MQKTEKELLEDTLTKLLIKSDKSVVISIKGSWGIGKSYFWEKFSKKIDKDKYAYVSLFGKTTLDDIKRSIIFQISSTAKFLEKFKNGIGSSKIFGVDLSSALTTLSKSDFKGIIICFDDFERISKQIDIKDVIGLISELKEQKECKIVIINNNDQLSKSDSLNNNEIVKKSSGKGKDVTKYYITQSNNKKSFQLYSEKIIDYEFPYSPTLKENFSVFNEKIKYFDKDVVLKFLEWTISDDSVHKNFNLRILKKLSNSLNIFSILNDCDCDQDIKNSISAYVFEKTYEKNISPYDFIRVNITSIHNNIDSALEKSFILNQEEFINNISVIQKNKIKSDVGITIHSLNQKFNFDLTFSNQDFVSELRTLFNVNEKDIVKILSISSFLYYMDLITRLKPEDEKDHRDFLINASKLYIDSLVDNNTLFNNSLNNELETSYKDYPDVIDYLSSLQDAHQSSKTKNSQSIITLLKKPKEKGGWSPKEEDILSSITVEAHIKHMKSSMDYLLSAFNFARWINEFSGNKPFYDTSKNIHDAITLISEESDENKLKLQNILKQLNKNG